MEAAGFLRRVRRPLLWIDRSGERVGRGSSVSPALARHLVSRVVLPDSSAATFVAASVPRVVGPGCPVDKQIRKVLSAQPAVEGMEAIA